MGVKAVLTMRAVLQELGELPAGPTQMYCDNQAALKIAKNPISSARSKHIDIMHHFIRERVELGAVKIDYIPTSQMVADVLTKALGQALFEVCREGMGVR
jgi:hypothetical protein